MNSEHLMNPFTLLIPNFKSNIWKTLPSISKCGLVDILQASKLQDSVCYQLLFVQKHIIES